MYTVRSSTIQSIFIVRVDFRPGGPFEVSQIGLDAEGGCNIV
jgi:hypothetical protein